MSAGRRWVAIEHVPFEGPATIATEAGRRGLELEICRVHLGEPLPAPAEVDGLIVMGGPMGVSDIGRHPHLADELELIAALAESDRPVLGVCLGAQLLAAALGARVYSGEVAEIGAGTVTATAEGLHDPVLGVAARAAEANAAARAGQPNAPMRGAIPVVHWHRDTFELPAGAVRLAGSDLYPNQAFRAGERAYGLQFHIEVDRALVEGWREHLPAGVRIAGQEREAVERVGRPALAAFLAL